MPHLTRRGLTLVELIVALTLLGIISAGLYRVLVNNQRIYHAQTQRIDLQQNIRAGATILPAEFRELDARDGDITAMTPTSITIRAQRQLAFICALPVLGGGNATFVIRRTPFYGVRDFNAATDSVFVYYEGDAATTVDDGWVIGAVTATPPPGVCSDGSAGRLLITAPTFAPGPGVLQQFNQTGRIEDGAVIRGWTPVTYLLYTGTDGRQYLGYQEAGTTSPLVGPLTANGLTFAYYDSTGAATAVPAQVAKIEIRLRAETGAPIRQSDGTFNRLVDSVQTWVSLRNNRRY